MSYCMFGVYGLVATMMLEFASWSVESWHKGTVVGGIV